jgi:hypothetical protein
MTAPEVKGASGTVPMSRKSWLATGTGFGDHEAMKTVLNVGAMSRQEKLQAMEELWEALSRPEESYPSPEWHGDVLRDRDQALKAGRDEFVPWEDAKRVLREKPK